MDRTRRMPRIKMATALRSFAADTRGFNLFEVGIAIMIMGAFIALALPMINAKPFNLPADIQDLSLQTQAAREFAISRTLHYRLRIVNSSSPYQYVIEQGTCTACTYTTWTFSTTVRTVNLRSNVSFTSGTLGLVAEFDERGQLVTSSPPTFTLQDTAHAWTKTVTVNSAGMVDTP